MNDWQRKVAETSSNVSLTSTYLTESEEGADGSHVAMRVIFIAEENDEPLGTYFSAPGSPSVEATYEGCTKVVGMYALAPTTFFISRCCVKT